VAPVDPAQHHLQASPLRQNRHLQLGLHLQQDEHHLGRPRAAAELGVDRREHVHPHRHPQRLLVRPHLLLLGQLTHLVEAVAQPLRGLHLHLLAYVLHLPPVLDYKERRYLRNHRRQHENP